MKFEAKEVGKRVQLFSRVCRRSGIKATHQRTEIYRELAGTNEHPDAETVYARVRKRIPAISLDTVYRTLRLLEKKGIILRVGLPGERTRFDGNTDRHSHFVCTECGFIGDLHQERWNDLQPPKEAMAMGTVNSVHVELRGLCNACRRKRRARG
ncbi:MAG TPA: transcriptional repressor [Thermodesulfobacteriota bacterium]|nr:transcriptional repressor [Thermodesulfobacteriota bacterium]